MSDDEVTRAADSAWLVELHAAAGKTSPADEIDDAPLRGDEVARFADDLPPETEVTIAGADLMEQVRQAVAAARPVDALTSLSLQEPAPEPVAAVPLPGADRPVDRWSPPPRLKPAPTPQAPPLLLPDVTSRPRRRVVAFAAVALVAIGVLIGGVLIGGGADAPSRDSVPVSTDVGGTGA